MKSPPRILATICAVLGMMVFHLGRLPQAQGKPFAVRAFQLVYRPQIKSHTLEYYKKEIDQAAGLGYNAMIINAAGTRTSSYQIVQPGKIRWTRYPAEKISDLLNHARQKGVEPIMEVKMIGKQAPIIARSLLKQHPDLLAGNPKAFAAILNPNDQFPDGQDAYDAVALPLLDNMIALYGKQKPRYLLLGIDEIPLGVLRQCAKTMHTTAPRLFATLLNRCVNHLLKKGITPVIYGDMLLSAKLARPGHGIHGFKYDPRFLASHTNYLKETKQSPGIFTAINHLNNRDKIIVIDWHYVLVPNHAYPSVDYFQTLGFRDVWGATWYDPQNIQDFSRYAARRGCGGMVATFWHVAFAPAVSHWKPLIFYNSAKFFRNPFFQPPHAIQSLTISDDQTNTHPATEKHNGIFITQGHPIQLNIKVQLTSSIIPDHPLLLLRDETKPNRPPLKVKLAFDAARHQLSSSINLPAANPKEIRIYGSFIRFVVRSSQYLVQQYWPAHLTLSSHPAVQTHAKATEKTLFAVDFSQLNQLNQTPQVNYLIQTVGRFHQPIVFMPPYHTPWKNENSLAPRNAYNTFAAVRPELWQHIVENGMRLKITFRMDQNLTRKPYAAILSMGNYFYGMRLLIGRNRNLLLQFANMKGGQPLWIPLQKAIPLKQWTTTRITLSPPDPTHHGLARVTLTLGDKTIRLQLPQPLLKYNNTALMGFGVEHKIHGGWKKAWPNFPGQIQSLAIRDF